MPLSHSHVHIRHESVFDGLTLVGQNDCKDIRGELIQIYSNQTRRVIPGVN